jgi:predicted PurR-regulated permease PerM
MKFKVFVCVALTFVVLLQASIVGLLVYAGRKTQSAVQTAQTTLQSKTSTLNQNTTSISKSLQSANKNLDNISNELKQSPYSGQLQNIP